MNGSINMSGRISARVASCINTYAIVIKNAKSKDKRGQIRNRVSIDERPEVVGQKARIGDWEIETVIGKNH